MTSLHLAVPHYTAEDWFLRLLMRQHREPPPLLAFAGQLPTQVESALDWLRGHMLALGGLAADMVSDDPHACWAERPLRQATRVVHAVLAGQGVVVNDDPAALGLDEHTAPLSEAGRQHAQQAASLAAQWLQAASSMGAFPDAATGRPPWNGWDVPAPQVRLAARCRLPVALLGHGLGVPAELQLALVHHPGARLCLAPAPASALLLRIGSEWDEALADLRRQLLGLLQPCGGLDPQDLALAWDLHCPGDALAVLSGPSASASFALGALWLLQRCAPDPWRGLLARLDASHLQAAALTAALGPGFELVPVGGAWQKGQSLQPLARALRTQAGQSLELHVSAKQAVPASQPAADDVPLQPHAGLLQALQRLASQADPLTDAQLQLWHQLSAPGQVPPTVDAATLKAVAAQPATSLRQTLLRCWASCDLAMKGQLHHQFVPLEVKPDALGDGHPLLGEEAVPFRNLQQVLRLHDGSMLHQAYLLRGLPGAGKSTLLRHHLQLAARGLLQQLAGTWQPDPGDPGSPPPTEVPVYLALSALPEDIPEAQVAPWVLQQLGSAGPPELQQLLAGRGTWAQRGLRARLLLDGLNELRVARVNDRPERARRVVNAVHALQPQALPMLLSIRSRHDTDLGRLTALRVDVQAWRREHIGQYLERRFPGAGERQLAALERVPGAPELCSRPMHLAAQCDLLASGFAAPPGDRAALYQAWLWQRLRRALGCDPTDPREPDTVWTEPPTDDPEQRLLTAADLAAIRDHDAWRSGQPRPLPRQGQLLRSLMRQALDQWYADADGGVSAGERTAAPQPWSQVARWLPDNAAGGDDLNLRRRFGRAARDLGLVTLDDAFSTWAFDHQSWGEYLASCVLLNDGPPASERLLQRLRAPDLPHACDEDEIAALDQEAASAWNAVPQAVWDELARDGLAVDLRSFVNGFLTEPVNDEDEVRRWLAEIEGRFGEFFSDRVLRFEVRDGQDTVVADLVHWGDMTGVGEALRLPRLAWRDPAKAGASGWQFLVQHRLYDPFRLALWNWMACHLQTGHLADLQRQRSRLELPPLPDGSEVLGLALLGLPPDGLRAWLQTLLLADAPGSGRADRSATGPLWPAMAGVLPVLQARLEPAGAWSEGGDPAQPPRRPDAVLQHLRRVLLLAAVDAGRDSLAGVRASGTLGLLDDPGAREAGFAELHRHWQGLRAQAFKGPGQRLRWRLQAGLLLGQLGDNIRYEFVRGATSDGRTCEGLRPHPALWARVGPQHGTAPFAIGSGSNAVYGDEQPAWIAHLPGFLACRLPLTVGEWRWFQRSAQGRGHKWAMVEDDDFNNPLQPVTGVNWHGLVAYAAWANALYAGSAVKAAGPRLALPTELQWEALARGPVPPWWQQVWQAVCAWSMGPESPAQTACAFNHASTRWLRPSPVGCFSRSDNPDGLSDLQGNVREFCASMLDLQQRLRGWRDALDRQQANHSAAPNDHGDRALRGGAFNVTASQCRPAYRSQDSPDYRSGEVGVRLVRVWLPHS